MLGPEGEIRFANARAEELLGFEREQLCQMRIDSPELCLTDLEGNPEEKGIIEAILKTGKEVDKYIICLRRSDKQRLVMNLTGNPTFNEKEEVDGAVFKFEKLAYQSQ